jgi:hypothetical protein
VGSLAKTSVFMIDDVLFALVNFIFFFVIVMVVEDKLPYGIPWEPIIVVYFI